MCTRVKKNVCLRTHTHARKQGTPSAGVPDACIFQLLVVPSRQSLRYFVIVVNRLLRQCRQDYLQIIHYVNNYCNL